MSLVAPTDATVLIRGETGTGKELIARAVHDKSTRHEGPMVRLNCSAISAGLVESELFGHVKGAFTGAHDRRVGRFELANNGTLFLDEVSELPLDTQAKLLRVLQEREFEPVGSSKTQKVNVRVIAASNRDLAADSRNGRFRADLYYRLNVFPIDLPALRDRRDDIPLLATHFMQRAARKLGKRLERIDADSMQRLVAHSWPGNIRDLQNVIERAAILADGSELVVNWELGPAAPGSAPPVAAATSAAQRHRRTRLAGAAGARAQAHHRRAEENPRRHRRTAGCRRSCCKPQALHRPLPDSKARVFETQRNIFPVSRGGTVPGHRCTDRCSRHVRHARAPLYSAHPIRSVSKGMSGADTLDELHQLARGRRPRPRRCAVSGAWRSTSPRRLNASESLISQVLDPDHVRTLAVFAHGASEPNYDYELDGTPCRAVLAGEIVHHESGLADKFPLTAQGLRGLLRRAADGRGRLGARATCASTTPARCTCHSGRGCSATSSPAAPPPNCSACVSKHELRESQERFRDLFDEAPIAYVHEGLDSTFIRANRTAMRVLGITAEDVPHMYGKNSRAGHARSAAPHASRRSNPSAKAPTPAAWCWNSAARTTASRS